MNYSIKTNLLSIPGAFVTNIQGRTATKKCICIPVDDTSPLVLGQKGVYLNSVAIEVQNPKYNDTHCVKIDFPKEMRERMTDEELRSTPIIGNLRPIERKADQMQVNSMTPISPYDDCPF